MKSTGNKFTIAELEQKLSTMQENANQHHAAALAYYPEEVYKTYDEEAVRLRKEYAEISNAVDIKYIELGLNGLDKEIFYLESRAKELENFYFKAINDDKVFIEQTLTEIKSQVWELKKKKNSLLSSEFFMS